MYHYYVVYVIIVYHYYVYYVIIVFHYSVERIDVTRWKQGYITPPLPYFIMWDAVTSLGENNVI